MYHEPRAAPVKRRFTKLMQVGALFIVMGTIVHALVPEPKIKPHHHPQAGHIIENPSAGETIVFKEVPKELANYFSSV